MAITPADAERTKRIIAAEESGEKNDATDVRSGAKTDARTDVRKDAKSGVRREGKTEAVTVVMIP